jgi:hypothetical protein
MLFPTLLIVLGSADFDPTQPPSMSSPDPLELIAVGTVSGTVFVGTVVVVSRRKAETDTRSTEAPEAEATEMTKVTATEVATTEVGSKSGAASADRHSSYGYNC